MISLMDQPDIFCFVNQFLGGGKNGKGGRHVRLWQLLIGNGVYFDAREHFPLQLSR